MTYILKTLWLIGYIPVSILMGVCFLIMLVIYPLVVEFYFIKTSSRENCPFTPISLSAYIDKKYRGLIKDL